MHLQGDVRGQLLARVADLAEQHPYSEVRGNMADLLPVLAGIQQDVDAQLAKPAPTRPAAAKLDLAAPPPASAQ
ncbi:hypothetical protein D3C72_2444340 [compost metagenome]